MTQDTPPQVQQDLAVMNFVGEMASLQLQERGVTKEVAYRMTRLVMLGGLVESLADGINSGKISPDEANQFCTAERIANLIETGQANPTQPE